MALDVGVGMALLAASAPITVALIKFMPSRNGASMRINEYVTRDVCAATHRVLDSSIVRIQGDIAEVKGDVKRLLEHLSRGK
jgi:hypothetical protein